VDIRDQTKVIAHFILYVADQQASTRFYRAVLNCEPRLDVPGMTEFELSGGAVLGLMPAAGIKRLLGDRLPDPIVAAGIPRAELYLVVSDPENYHSRALESGAKELSPLQFRDWGHEVAYGLDLDSHVIAFARKV
jgi:catechol 2,3-dioxygenase-like lactoylglutathione lyase family enzyme